MEPPFPKTPATVSAPAACSRRRCSQLLFGFSDRFQREAKVLARLNHPHIVSVHDFGKAGGFYFLLMEFVDGVNLRQLLQAKRLTPKEALSIVPPVCDALQCGVRVVVSSSPRAFGAVGRGGAAWAEDRHDGQQWRHVPRASALRAAQNAGMDLEQSKYVKNTKNYWLPSQFIRQHRPPNASAPIMKKAAASEDAAPGSLPQALRDVVSPKPSAP